MAARRDEPLAEAVSQFLEAEADAIAAMISEGKESGSIDPSLSTDAMVLLCQALGLGLTWPFPWDRGAGPHRPQTSGTP